MSYKSVVKSLGDNLRIVVVGANDGRVNDPLYEVMRAQPDLASILLVEPQVNILNLLDENYAFHPRATIINSAVGNDSRRILYCVAKRAWGKVEVPYAINNGWPDYRAPSGVASFSRTHVHDWLKHFLIEGDAEDFIDEVVVKVRSLISILEETEFGTKIDVLQVDAEGFDDEVIYNSSIDQLKPSIVYYEESHLSKRKARNLRDYLEGRCYKLSGQGANVLAMKARVLF